MDQPRPIPRAERASGRDHHDGEVRSGRADLLEQGGMFPDRIRARRLFERSETIVGWRAFDFGFSILSIDGTRSRHSDVSDHQRRRTGFVVHPFAAEDVAACSRAAGGHKNDPRGLVTLW